MADLKLIRNIGIMAHIGAGKKCFVILAGIAFMVLLSTSCKKECDCRDADGNVVITKQCLSSKNCEDCCKEGRGFKVD